MKKSLYLLAPLVLSLLIICTGCTGMVTANIPGPAAGVNKPGTDAPAVTDGEQPESTAAPANTEPAAPTDGNNDVLSGKIADIRENSLLLMPTDGSGGLYWCTVTGIEPSDDRNPPVMDLFRRGMLIDILHAGPVDTSYPMRFSADVGSVNITGQEDDFVGFYLTVISDLMDVDPGLNDGIEMLAFDLTELKNLSNPEKEALCYFAGERFGLYAFEATFEELREQGLISGDFQEDDDGEFTMPYFDKGLSIAFGDVETGEDSFTFSVSKWRSALGAYFFSDCTASRQSEAGTEHSEWTYTVGSHAIS